MIHNVFISHSVEDKAVAETVRKVLEEKGIKCWIAHRDILPSMPYCAAIIDAITECQMMVFIFSSCSNSSQHVMRELDLAVNRGTSIIPFRIEDVPPSKSIEYFVNISQWLDAFPPPFEKHLETLVGIVQRLLARKGEGDAHPSATEVLEEVKKIAPEVRREKHLPAVEELKEKVKLNEYEKGLQLAEELLRQDKWIPCVNKCGRLLEKALRQLLNNLLKSLEDESTRDRIIEAQKKIGEGKDDSQSLGLGQLINLYMEANVFTELRKFLTSNLQKTKRINWEQVKEWYEASITGGDSASLTEDIAMQMTHWIKVFMYDCELAGKAPTVTPVPEEERSPQKCPVCEQLFKRDWNFCPQCGAVLHVTCETCHRVLAPDFKICPYCEEPVRRRGATVTDQARKAKERYRVLCEGAYLDGVVNYRERLLLDQKRLELGLSTEEAESIERQCAPEKIVEYNYLVEGVLVDGVISETEQEFLRKKAEQMGIEPWVADQIKETVIAMRKSTLSNQQQA